MMDARSIAEKLVDARRHGHAVALENNDILAIDEATGWQIQALTVEGLDTGIAGWKVALPQDGLVLSAPILDGLLFQAPATLPRRIHGLGGVECEIAFRIGRRIAASLAKDEITTAIDSACVAVEVLHSRWPTGLRTPRPALFADMLANAALVVGEPVCGWAGFNFATIAVEVIAGGQSLARQRGGLPSGDPLAAVVALADHLARRGLALEPGQYVTTGSFTGVHVLAQGEEMSVSFAGFPPLRLAFEPAPST